MAKTRISDAAKSIVASILTAGKSLRLAQAKANDLHPKVLQALTGVKADSKDDRKGIKPRPVKVWFQAFTQLHGLDFWPIDAGEAVGYRTVLRSADGRYCVQAMDAATYFNNFQSWLHSQKLVQATAKKATKSSPVHVVTTDEVLKRLTAMYLLVPEDRRKASLKTLQALAKQAFGVQHFEPLGIEIPKDEPKAEQKQAA